MESVRPDPDDFELSRLRIDDFAGIGTPYSPMSFCGCGLYYVEFIILIFNANASILRFLIYLHRTEEIKLQIYTNLVVICLSTHFKSVTTESVDGRRLSALVFVI